MKSPVRLILLVFVSIMLAGSASAQVDDYCREFGLRPSLDDLESKIPYIYGRIIVRGHDPTAKLPLITVNFLDARNSQRRLTIDRSGNYCFRRNTSGGGTLIVEVEGVETARKQVSSIGSSNTREDFEVYVSQPQSQQLGPPGVVSAKYSRPRNDKTVDLYQNAAEAEAAKDTVKAIKYVKQIVTVDPTDFVAWAKLGSLYLGQNSLVEAETAFRKAVELKPEYTPAMLNLGTLLALEKKFDAAIVIFTKAVTDDPTSARGFRLLGEAYLQVRKGTLGLQALNEALKLDPLGMAECHLLIARLYDLAGAKNLAAAEYKAFLTKVPKHADKKKFEQYIKDNPEQ